MLPLCRKTLVSPKDRPAKPPRTLGERLRAWRLERGLEQRDVAAMLGVRPATVGRWERGQKQPAAKLMPRIRVLLGPGSSVVQKTPPERLRSARGLRESENAAVAENSVWTNAEAFDQHATDEFLRAAHSDRRKR